MVIDYTNIGLRIKRYRMDKGLSQEKLAEALIITPGHLSRVETGKRYPSLEMIISIANALGVSADDLLTDSLVCSTSAAGSEVHRLLLDSNENEMKILIKVLIFSKQLLVEHGI